MAKLKAFLIILVSMIVLSIFLMPSLSMARSKAAQNVNEAKKKELEITKRLAEGNTECFKYVSGWDVNKLEINRVTYTCNDSMYIAEDPEGVDIVGSSPNLPIPVNPVPPMFDVDAYLSRLSFGSIILNTPDKMRINDKFIVKLTLSPDNTILTEISPVGRTTVDRARIDKRMEAVLVGSGFDIKNITDEVLATSLSEETVWMWEISPVKSGNQILCATLSVKIDIDGEKISRTIKTFEKTVHVKISPINGVKEFVVKNWQFIVSGMIVPLIAWYWTHRRRRTSRKPHGQ